VIVRRQLLQTILQYSKASLQKVDKRRFAYTLTG